jgi:hypothetical protein
MEDGGQIDGADSLVDDGGQIDGAGSLVEDGGRIDGAGSLYLMAVRCILFNQHVSL